MGNNKFDKETQKMRKNTSFNATVNWCNKTYIASVLGEWSVGGMILPHCHFVLSRWFSYLLACLVYIQWGSTLTGSHRFQVFISVFRAITTIGNDKCLFTTRYKIIFKITCISNLILQRIKLVSSIDSVGKYVLFQGCLP